jgi:hypothetical protein
MGILSGRAGVPGAGPVRRSAGRTGAGGRRRLAGVPALAGGGVGSLVCVRWRAAALARWCACAGGRRRWLAGVRALAGGAPARWCACAGGRDAGSLVCLGQRTRRWLAGVPACLPVFADKRRHSTHPVRLTRTIPAERHTPRVLCQCLAVIGGRGGRPREPPSYRAPWPSCPVATAPRGHRAPVATPPRTRRGGQRAGPWAEVPGRGGWPGGWPLGGDGRAGWLGGWPWGGGSRQAGEISRNAAPRGRAI